MTLDEAKQKILDRVLATTEGWEIGFGEIGFGEYMTTSMTNASLPGMTVQYEVDCPHGAPRTYAVRLRLADKTVLLVNGDQTDLCHHVRSILEVDKTRQVADFDNSVIQFAESLGWGETKTAPPVEGDSVDKLFQDVAKHLERPGGFFDNMEKRRAKMKAFKEFLEKQKEEEHPTPP